jgi:putative acetyltransferase
VQLRRRDPQDVADLFDLFNERSVLEFALMRDPFGSADEVELWLKRMSALARFELVAVCDGRCVGFGAIYGLRDHLDHCGALMLAVRESWRGRGTGALLLDALLRAGSELLGLRKLQLTVLTDNAQAITLYQRHGFQIEGWHRRFVRRGETFADAYSMAILLEPWAQSEQARACDEIAGTRTALDPVAPEIGPFAAKKRRKRRPETGWRIGFSKL